MDLKSASILTAMVTPFDNNINFDKEKFEILINFLFEHHTEGLVVAGTTGESPTLTHEEEIEIFKDAIRIVNGRGPIICGVGTNDTRDTCNFVKEVAQLDGVAAGLCVVPYYNRPNQEGIYQHFKAISEASDLPIILYNVPKRTGITMTVDTVLRLAKLPNIIGIKECAGIDALSTIIENTDDEFLVFSGEDNLAFHAKAAGGNGIISVASHVVGDKMYAMYQALDDNDVEHAAAIQRSLIPVFDAVFSVPSPAPIKAILNEWGIDVGGLRLPLVACTSEETNRILSVINR